MSSLVCSQSVIWFLVRVSDCCPLLPTWLLTMVACDTQKPCLNLWRPSLGCMSLFLVGLNGGSRAQLMFSPGLSGIEVVACQKLQKILTNLTEFSLQFENHHKDLCWLDQSIEAHFQNLRPCLRPLQCGTLQVRLPRWCQMKSRCLDRNRTGSKTPFGWVASISLAISVICLRILSGPM